MLSDELHKARLRFMAWYLDNSEAEPHEVHQKAMQLGFEAGQRAAFEEAAKEAQVFVDGIKGDGPKSSDARNVARIIHNRIEALAAEVGKETKG